MLLGREVAQVEPVLMKTPRRPNKSKEQSRAREEGPYRVFLMLTPDAFCSAIVAQGNSLCDEVTGQDQEASREYGKVLGQTYLSLR